MAGLTEARAVADAVLYEGYVLYPYRATAEKNRLRFQWGVLAPRDVCVRDPSERSEALTTVLVDGAATTISVTVRLLQVQRRTVHAPDGTQLDRLDAGEIVHLPFDEAFAHELTLVVPLGGGPTTGVFDLEGGVEREDVRGGWLRRERLPLRLRVEADLVRPSSPYQVTMVTLRVSNDGDPDPTPGDRAEWLRRSLVAVHLLMELDAGRFVSLLDPPRWAAELVAECRNEGLFPVLVGEDRRVMLSSPIILYDHPLVAPESGADLFDSLEIDELLSLRTITLSDAEKREVRGTDPRAAALLDGVEALPPELWGRLHGAIRTIDSVAKVADEPDPDTDVVVVRGAEVRRGSTVLLRPGARRADAYDLLLAGRRASVAGVFRDLDDRVHLAVVLDDDPGADLRLSHGRYLYFAPDEVEPLPAEAGE